MDEQRFDQLSRRFAMLRTRRQALKALAGVVAASVVGVRSTAAQGCAAAYSACSADEQCCAGAVCKYGLCMPGCRIDGAFTSAWMSPPGNSCAVCTPEISTTSWSPANEGMSCWNGDPNAGITTCQSGVCRSTGPVDCRPQTVCHTASINLTTGQCDQGFAPAGTTCGNEATCYGEVFTPADACDGNGFCIGGGSQARPCAPYVCGAGACTASCQTDADCASGAHCDDGQCFPDADLGQPCDEGSDCQSGICAEGICCNQRCDAPCETCNGATPGFCGPVVCDDGLRCTTEVCEEATGTCRHTVSPGSCLIDGVCVPHGAVNPANACHVCDWHADQATWAAVVCDDGLSCTADTCDPASGCVHPLNAGFCLIDGVCYPDGALNPANVCEVCDAAVDPDSWSALGCPDDLLSCTTATCDPASGCGQSLIPGTCLIDNVCYADNGINPANACQVCDPDVDPDGWAAVVCPDDALTCTTATCDPGTGCGQTINPASCVIAGVCYGDGTVNPANACEVCDPDADAEGWSIVRCASGACSSGTCVTSLSGELSPDGQHGGIRCENPSARPYHIFTFTHDGGPLQLGMRGASGGGGTLYDPLLALYTSFNPANPCANRIVEADDGGCGLDSYISLPELAAGTFSILASTVYWPDSWNYGTYTVTFGQGPAC